MSKFIITIFISLSFTGVKAELIKMTTLDWPPFYGKNLKDGGFFTALTNEVLKLQNHSLKVDFLPWARAVSQGKRGKYHALLGCWYTKEREKHFIFSKTNVDSTPHFLARPDSTIKIEKFDNLYGYTIGLIRGYALSPQLKEAISTKKVRKLEASSHEALFKLLKVKRIDLVLENSTVMKAKLKKKWPSKAFNLKKVGSSFIDGFLYICWSRKKDGTQKISEDFNKGLKTIIENGTYERLWKKYGM
ncbi:transporter substrate-binding domain-containing protein [Bacteriovoracales bacterium]|nr:transporter substrate-binding domain-containing protein [Bacteriovoracales bacterium]